MDWKMITDNELRQKIKYIVIEGGKQFRNPEAVKMDMTQLMNKRKEDKKEYIPFCELDLGRGYSGICILCGALDRIDIEGGWDEIGHLYLMEMQQVLSKQGVQGLGLFNGLSGVIMGARALSRNGQRYTNFIQKLTDFFLVGIPNITRMAELNLEKGPALHEFDVIQGLSGIGRCLLCFVENHELQVELRRILGYLVNMTKERNKDGIRIPGWFIAPDNQHMANDKENYPQGHFNCGMSHGIPGVLSLLSIALSHGIEIHGQREAIGKIASWLTHWRTQDEFGYLWPARISWNEYIEGKVPNVKPREAWCYGGPGVARSLWLAGTALQKEEWKQTALKACLGTAKRPIENWNIESDTFCHGTAGLLQIMQRMYSESKDEEVRALRNRLTELLISKWNKVERYGYQEVKGADRQNLAGLLDGAAGVYTVLAGLIQEQDFDWDSVFLIR